MSALRSWLKSPEAMTCQAVPGLVSAPPPMIDVPFISQIAGVPSLFCQRKSDKASALKSLRTGDAMLMVVVAAVLRLFEALPSLTTQVRVRVLFTPPLVGFHPLANVTESSTCL